MYWRGLHDKLLAMKLEDFNNKQFYLKQECIIQKEIRESTEEEKLQKAHSTHFNRFFT